VASYAELQRKVEHLAGALSEALEQQTATAEILRVIGTSPMDAQPVFDAIARSGVRVCGAQSCTLFVIDRDMVRVAATHGVPAERVERFRTQFPKPLRAENHVTQVLRERRIFHLVDIEHNPVATPEHIENARLGGYHTRLMVPMLRGDSTLGLIAVTHQAPTPFSDQQIALLQTFADQAVIAIENVRLFTELQEKNRALTEAHAQVTETLEQQTATSEILRVISSSPTNVQPVFDTIVRSALRLCNGATTAVFRVDGGMLHHPANYGGSPNALAAARARYPRPVGRDSIPGIAILTRSEYEVPDTEDPSAVEMSRETGRILGIRSLFAVPMLRDGEAVGAIVVTRREPGRFATPEVSLLKTFADQAVIAIENVRLFKELEARNRDLTVALEQQTATAEILRVISRSQTDVQPVFDTIVRSAVRLCNGLFSALFQFDGELIHHVAQHNVTPEGLAELHRIFPVRPTRALGVGRVILERAVVHIPDMEVDPEFQHVALSRAVGFRSSLWVPMLREGTPIGVIAVNRAEPGPFSENQIELLKTFADQAVIAVENVRLFKELEARTGELTRSVDQLTALGEISQAVGSTLDVETVLQTIVSRASQLAGADGCAIYEYDDATEAFHIRATHNLDPVLVETLRATPLRKGEGAMGRAAETREPTQVADIAAPGAYQSHIRDTLLGAGYRALLSVPLLREGAIIGSLSLNRHTPGEFPPEAVEVLKTFATQSALAIQNARLFREIADKSRQLEVASQHKSEFLANMSHELRTPLNAIIGFSEVLAEKMFGDVNAKQAEYLQDILESGRHLLSLINDILDLSKIEAGHMELEPADFDLPGAIDNALTLVRERATRRGITLGRTIDERLGIVHGDERKVKQILLNLLSNALKFTPEGGRVDVGAGRHDEVAEVSVADTGIGIAPADQEAVFEEFRQVGAAERKAEGTGLGLALSRKFVELHGGTIWVQSEPGRGSTFTFTLPVRADQVIE
jgi:signal transduction histidine kinase